MRTTNMAVPAVLVIAAILTGGCGSSSIVGQWQDPSPSPTPFTSVMVIALGKRMDLRRTYEDLFVQGLAARGVHAVAGYTVLPTATDDVDRDELASAVRASGVDAVVITRVLQMETQVIAPAQPYSPAASGLYAYQAGAWSTYYEPAPTLQPYEQTVATLETSLFEVSTEKLIWSATTKTFDADLAEKQIPGLVKTLVAAMAKAKLVP